MPITLKEARRAWELGDTTAYDNLLVTCTCLYCDTTYVVRFTADNRCPTCNDAKYIPSSKYEDAILEGAEKRAVRAYRQTLRQAGQKTPIHVYDFHRGFEYGVQWALDNPIPVKGIE